MLKIICLILLFFSPYPLLAHIILLDPGHGGDDVGAQKKVNGVLYKEKDLTLQMAMEMGKVLQNFGHKIYYTRTNDLNISLIKRSKLADEIKADIVLSIHLNSTKNALIQGIELYYLDGVQGKVLNRFHEKDFKVTNSKDPVINSIVNQVIIKECTQQSKNLALNIHQQLSKKHFKVYQLKDRGIRPGVFYVLTFSKRPAVLLEIGFMSSVQELEKMIKKEYQISFANALATGVKDYFLKRF